MSTESVLKELPVLIKHCFSKDALIFCSHFLEEERASELLLKCRTNDITLIQLIQTVKEFLNSHNVQNDKFELEMQKVKNYFMSLPESIE